MSCMRAWLGGRERKTEGEGENVMYEGLVREEGENVMYEGLVRGEGEEDRGGGRECHV